MDYQPAYQSPVHRQDPGMTWSLTHVNIYKSGYDDGHEHGAKKGQEEAYDNGLKMGYKEGYAHGTQDGYAKGVFTGFLWGTLTAFTGFAAYIWTQGPKARSQ